MLRISTAHSDYMLDMEQKRFSRQTRHERANQIPDLSSGEWNDFLDLDDIVVGAVMFLILPNGRWLRSTPVESVEEVEVAA